jgi:hypothetical protein
MDKHLLAAVCLSLTTAGTACTPEQLALFVDAISSPGDDHSGDPPPPCEDPWVSTEDDAYVSTFNGLTVRASVDDRRAYILGATGPSYSSRSYRVDAVDVTGPALSRHAQTALGSIEGGSYPLTVFAPRAGAEIDKPLAARIASPNSLIDNDFNDPLSLTLEPVSGLDGDVPNDLLQVDDNDALPTLGLGMDYHGFIDISGSQLVHVRMDWFDSLSVEYRELGAAGGGEPSLVREFASDPDSAYGAPTFALDDSLGGIFVRYVQRQPSYETFVEFVSIGSGDRVHLPTNCASDGRTFTAARIPIVSDRGEEFVVAETCPQADPNRSDVRLFAVSNAEDLSVREVASFVIDHNSPEFLREVSIAATPDHVLVSALYRRNVDDGVGELSSQNHIFRVERDGSVIPEHTLVLDASDGRGIHRSWGMLPEPLSNGTDFFVFTVSIEPAIRGPEDLRDPTTNEYVAPESFAVLRRIRPN